MMLRLLLSRFSRVRLCATPWTTAHQVPLSIEFPRKHTGAGCHFLLQGIFLTQGLNPRLLDWQEDSLPLSYLGSPDNRIGDFYFLYTFLFLSLKNYIVCYFGIKVTLNIMKISY